MGSWVATLLLAMLLLELGSGLQGVLIPIEANRLGFPTSLIGGLGTAYYVGFVVGCLALPRTIRRVGHIRCFAALAAIASTTMLVHAMLTVPLIWLVQRATFGFCFAGLFMVIESWLNDRATSATRGRLLSLYMAATWTGVISGKLLFPIVPSDPFYAFALCSIAVSASLVPIVLTNGSAPSIPSPAPFDVLELIRRTPTGITGAFAAGMANGAFWTFAPLYAEDRSGSAGGVGLFMAACALGGAIGQWPLGLLSDRIDRRGVLLGAGVASAAAGLLLVWNGSPPLSVLCALGALFGAAALPIYSLCVAHANDRADPSSYIEVSSFLLLTFGLGAVAGPLMAGPLIAKSGLGALFAFTATIHVLVAVFTLIRMRSAAAPPQAERAVFSVQPPIGHGTQTIVDLAPTPDMAAANSAVEPVPEADTSAGGGHRT